MKDALLQHPKCCVVSHIEGFTITLLLKVIVGCWLSMSAMRSLALDCSHAKSSVDGAICGNQGLLRLDERLNQLYGDLLPQITVKTQGELRAQQRTWLIKRDRVCVNGNNGCLQKLYEERIDQLSALVAESRVADNKRDSLAPPFTVLSTWRATGIRDPLAAKPASKTDVPDSLARADLPDVGKLVTASPGRVCVEGQDCRFIAWKKTEIAKVPWAEAIERVLGLSQSVQVLVGDSGATNVPGLMLLPQSGGVVWAIFSLRKTSIQDGNYAIEEWHPAAGHVGDPTQP